MNYYDYANNGKGRLLSIPLHLFLRRGGIFFMLKNIKKPMFLVCINNVETVDVFVAIITLKSDVYV